ncbi:hypothetical protein Sgri01_07239 [Streptomyces griseus]
MNVVTPRFSSSTTAWWKRTAERIWVTQYSGSVMARSVATVGTIGIDGCSYVSCSAVTRKSSSIASMWCEWNA